MAYSNTVPPYFHWADYLLFSFVLCVSSLIGVYHSWKSRTNNTTANYFMGGGTLGVFPVAMSTSASAMSAAMMLSIPADVYLTGTMNCWWAVSFSLGIPLASYIYLPIFHKLNIISVNQYLELRFNSAVRRTSSLLFIVIQIIVLSIFVYGPSLALQQVTGIDVYISVGITFIICTFYTTIGGIKAVVWTDVLQLILMIASLVALLIKGIADMGIGNVWERNWNSSRIDFFNIEPQLTTRNTVWSMMIGGGIYWMGMFATNQAFVQRFLTLPTKRQAQKAMLINVATVASMMSLSCFVGLVIYAKYHDCDPLKSKLVTKADQIVPFFVMDTFGGFPGLPGLFVAGVFSAALSSLSSLLNAMALVALEDFIRPFFPNLNEAKATTITKGMSIICGTISFGFVFVVSNIRAVLEAIVSATSAGLGTILGVFTLGMFVPWANSIGAGIGMVVSFVSIMCLGVSTQISKSRGQFRDKQLKPTSTEGCANFTLAVVEHVLTHVEEAEGEEAFSLLKISFMWYTLMGTVMVLVVGTVTSFLTGAQNPGNVDPRLICHFIGRRFGRNQRSGDRSLELML